VSTLRSTAAPVRVLARAFARASVRALPSLLTSVRVRVRTCWRASWPERADWPLPGFASASTGIVAANAAALAIINKLRIWILLTKHRFAMLEGSTGGSCHLFRTNFAAQPGLAHAPVAGPLPPPGESSKRTPGRNGRGSHGRKQMITIIIILIIGALVGWLAGMIMRSGGGLVFDIIVGIVGALIAGFLFGGGASILNAPLSISSILYSLLGAIILLAIVKVVRRGT
jgi:uncharacterized membrane protein YeaQ/YmgE (transglycosylase-associated protein family)